MEILARFYRLVMPRFRCTLTTSLDHEQVEDILRKIISTAMFFSSPGIPLKGNFAPPRFNVDVNDQGEQASTKFSGTLERGQGETRIHTHAELGMLGIVIPSFTLGIVYLAALDMRLDQAISAALLIIGALLFVIFRIMEIRCFWRDVYAIVEILEYHLAAEVVFRSHGKSGVPIDNNTE